MLNFAAVFASLLFLSANPVTDPYASLSQSEREALNPQVDRWIHDQLQHDWSDLWEIQDQTSEFKNEVMLGAKDAPDLDKKHFIDAMNETINSEYPEIKAFSLREVKAEPGGYLIRGCGEQKRESWKQISVIYVHARLLNGKILFGLQSGKPDSCKL